MTLGEKVQRLRKREGLSQEQFAEKLNVSRQAVSKWELDTTIPEVDKIIQMSQLFNVTSDYLLGIENEENINVSKSETVSFIDLHIHYLGYLILIYGAYSFIGSIMQSITYASFVSMNTNLNPEWTTYTDTFQSGVDPTAMLIIILSFIQSITFIVTGYLLAKYLKKHIVDKAIIRKQKIEMRKELSE